MKVFISWSGDRSRQVAELLHRWIQCVVQAVEPWVSSSDIDRGALWFTQITNELSLTTHGIICLTNANKDKPWILFEAGALAKGLSSTRVYTFLIDLEPADIKDPLAQFNHTRPLKEDMFKLISSINSGLEGQRLKESVLLDVFKTYWPQFEAQFAEIITSTENSSAPVEHRTSDDILSEILSAVRTIDKRVRTLEYDDKISVKKPNATSATIRGTIKEKTDASILTAKELRKRVTKELANVEIINMITTGSSDQYIADQVSNRFSDLSAEEVLQMINAIRWPNS